MGQNNLDGHFKALRKQAEDAKVTRRVNISDIIGIHLGMTGEDIRQILNDTMQSNSDSYNQIAILIQGKEDLSNSLEQQRRRAISFDYPLGHPFIEGMLTQYWSCSGVRSVSSIRSALQSDLQAMTIDPTRSLLPINYLLPAIVKGRESVYNTSCSTSDFINLQNLCTSGSDNSMRLVSIVHDELCNPEPSREAFNYRHSLGLVKAGKDVFCSGLHNITASSLSLPASHDYCLQKLVTIMGEGGADYSNDCGTEDFSSTGFPSTEDITKQEKLYVVAELCPN